MLDDFFEKTMTSPPKQDMLVKAYNARSCFREVTEDSPDYDEYYDEETWVLSGMETKICATDTYFWKIIFDTKSKN